MPKKMNSKISPLVTALAVSMCVLCVVALGSARGDKSGAGSEKSPGNASVRQQGRPDAAKSSGKTSVHQQGRPDAAKSSGKTSVRQQGRPDAAKSSGKTSVRQQGRPDMKATGNAVLSRPGKQSRPTSKLGMVAYQRAQRGEHLQGWGRRVRVDPVYVTQWHQPRYQSGSYFYGGFGYTTGFSYGFWAFGTPRYHHHHSPFFLFGLLFILGERTVIVRQPAYVYYPISDYSYNPNYHDSNYLRHGRYSGVNTAINDIRNSWLNNDSDPLGRHLSPTVRLSVYLDGKYAYSMSGKDYRGMTADAMHHTGTISFTPYKVAKRSDGAYVTYAKQQLYDADHNYKVAYVSYTLALKKGNWMIVAVGSSDHKLN